MNLAKAFEKMADGPIIGAVIGPDDRKHFAERSNRPLYGKLISWDVARPVLDYEYDNGYDGADCHAVYAWTETQVLFVSEYDGATGINSIPRNPTACEPSFGGD